MQGYYNWIIYHSSSNYHGKNFFNCTHLRLCVRTVRGLQIISLQPSQDLKLISIRTSLNLTNARILLHKWWLRKIFGGKIVCFGGHTQSIIHVYCEARLIHHNYHVLFIISYSHLWHLCQNCLLYQHKHQVGRRGHLAVFIILAATPPWSL